MPKSAPVFGRRPPRKAWQTTSKTTTERGYGWAWQKLRKAILKRDSYLCQQCWAEGRATIATEVDHIRSKQRGGTDEPSNLRAICSPCHKTKTAEEARQGRRG